MKRDPLSHRFLSECKRLDLASKHILVAASGGLDSMVLLDLLWSWQKRLRYSLAVGHVHHGLDAEQKQLRFRKSAYLTLKKWSEEKGVPFYSNVEIGSRGLRLHPSPSGRSSEATLRAFRWRLLKNWMTEFHPQTLVATAHQAEDLLETRVLRLIRGTGVGGLKAMSGRDGEIVRPLLHMKRKDLVAYAWRHHTPYIEDPSNRDLTILRNWIRKKWLPLLEKQSPGAVHAMARSLEMIIASLKQGSVRVQPRAETDFELDGGLDVRVLILAPPEERRQIIRDYLKDVGVDHYTHRHIEEIVKRLDKIPKKHTFRLLGLVWCLDPWRIRASREGIVTDESSVGLL